MNFCVRRVMKVTKSKRVIKFVQKQKMIKNIDIHAEFRAKTNTQFGRNFYLKTRMLIYMPKQ